MSFTNASNLPPGFGQQAKGLAEIDAVWVAKYYEDKHMNQSSINANWEHSKNVTVKWDINKKFVGVVGSRPVEYALHQMQYAPHQAHNRKELIQQALSNGVLPIEAASLDCKRTKLIWTEVRLDQLHNSLGKLYFRNL